MKPAYAFFWAALFFASVADGSPPAWGATISNDSVRLQREGQVNGQTESRAEAADEIVEEILVTGSRIRRRDFFSPSPIVTLDRSEFDLSGTVGLEVLLNELPQTRPGIGAGTNNTPEGSARVNLRALGDHRTLVLLNGRRYAANGIFGTVDLNGLPPVIVDRVEIITGGASAVYGSDAIAGAVNFILRDDFEGFEASVQYDVTERGDGDTYNVDLAYGMGVADGHGHLTLFGNYYDRTSVYQDDRGFSRNPLKTNDNTGEVISAASFISPAGGIVGPPSFLDYTFDPDGAPRLFVVPDDQFNTSSENALRAPMERWSLNAFGHYDVNERLRASLELQYAHSIPKQRRADAFRDLVDVNVDRPDISPALRSLLETEFESDGDGVVVTELSRLFTAERGNTTLRNERDFYRAMLGFEGDLGSRWSWSADYSFSKTDLDMRVSKDNSIGRIRQGLLVDPATGECFDPSGGCVPVNPFGAGNLSQAGTDFIALTGTTRDEDLDEHVVNASVRGPLVELWAGDVDVAFGLEYRRDKVTTEPSGNILTGDSLYAAPDFISSGTIKVKELFAEARVPLVTDLPWARYVGLETGVRWSDYNVLDDDAWSWKLGGEWQISHGLRLRTMFQRAIRAPNATELFTHSAQAFPNFFFGLDFDQCSASRDPVGNGLTELCIAQGIAPDQIGTFEASMFPTGVQFFSNPDIKEEKADTVTAGFVWQPESLPRLALSVDYFDIDIDDASTLLFPDVASILCFGSRDPDNQFCQPLERGPSGDFETGLITPFNAAEAKSEGVDVSVNYDWDVDALGVFGHGANLSLALLGTYYIEVGSKATPDVPFVDCAGKFGPLCTDFVFGGALPEIQTYTRLTYASGPFTASLRWRYIDELKNSENEVRAITDRPPAVLAVPRVSDAHYFDLTLVQDIGERVSVSLGIVNLTDKDPPFLGSQSRDANTDPGTYDVLGRRFFLRLTARY